MRAPRWLKIAAVVLVGQTLVKFAVAPNLVAAAALAVGVVIALLVLRGNRLAWAVALVGAAGQLIDSLISTEHYWTLSVGGIAAVSLLAPSSVRYVWSRRPHRHAGPLPLLVKGRYDRIVASVYDVIARTADWETGQLSSSTASMQRSYKLLLWRLGVGCIGLFALYAAAYEWQHGSGDGSPIVNVIASATRVCYVLVQVVFIAVSLIAAYQHFTKSARTSQPPL
jgi:xanthosine utilization system XapX-like protein